MSDKTSIEEATRLRQVLREWKLETPLPAGIQRNVWKQIDSRRRAGRSNTWRLLLIRLDDWFARPSLAMTYVAVLLVAGLIAGYCQGRLESARMDRTMSRLYVQSVDPYQAPRH